MIYEYENSRMRMKEYECMNENDMIYLRTKVWEYKTDNPKDENERMSTKELQNTSMRMTKENERMRKYEPENDKWIRIWI